MQNGGDQRQDREQICVVRERWTELDHGVGLTSLRDSVQILCRFECSRRGGRERGVGLRCMQLA